MAGYQNNMSRLVDKIEARLGLIPLTPHLPKEFGKDAWANYIKNDTLITYSRYMPYRFSYKIDKDTATKKNGWYYINEDYLGSQSILGVGDIDWSMVGNKSAGLAQTWGYGVPDAGIASNFTLGDIYGMKNRADFASLFSVQVIPEFQPPNKIRLLSAGNNDVDLGDFNIFLFLVHNESLTTIPATAMETFEELAQADVATFLSNNLRYWDNFETVFASIDLKLSLLENEAQKRDTVLDYIKQNYVSAHNKAVPLIMTI